MDSKWVYTYDNLHAILDFYGACSQGMTWFEDEGERFKSFDALWNAIPWFDWISWLACLNGDAPAYGEDEAVYIQACYRAFLSMFDDPGMMSFHQKMYSNAEWKLLHLFIEELRLIKKPQEPKVWRALSPHFAALGVISSDHEEDSLAALFCELEDNSPPSGSTLYSAADLFRVMSPKHRRNSGHTDPLEKFAPKKPAAIMRNALKPKRVEKMLAEIWAAKDLTPYL